jgi:hypothetical protein
MPLEPAVSSRGDQFASTLGEVARISVAACSRRRVKPLGKCFPKDMRYLPRSPLTRTTYSAPNCHRPRLLLDADTVFNFRR